MLPPTSSPVTFAINKKFSLLSPLPLIPWKKFSSVLEGKNNLQVTPEWQIRDQVLGKTNEKKNPG